MHKPTVLLLAFGAMACRQEPKGVEVSLAVVAEAYQAGELKKLSYSEADNLVLAEPTREALNTYKYSDMMDYSSGNGQIKQAQELRLKVKVISLADFNREMEKATGRRPVVEILK
ncbi:hypothetical protein [Hymenobacter latericus]|uniref:hypothetical protein n=1 Tax=Hymenobacter sp. YIM 151858-1 TaxID=2987688 RepID=UPI0022276788|nr:hypothetical protein [Hymenobacter sp. YIM 151858-1]UYZ59788.1 hypothetical protein OIS50_03090 [Hymenobacter sp. YIM 151858-1]